MPWACTWELFGGFWAVLARNYTAEAAERVVRVWLFGGPQPLLLLLVQDRLELKDPHLSIKQS